MTLRWLRIGMPILAAVGGGLIAWAALTTPHLLIGRACFGLAAAEAMLLAYAAIAFFTSPRTPVAAGYGAGFGLAAGAVYAVEIVLEYVLLPADNTPYGLVEFGAVFAVFAAAGATAAWRTQRFKSGLGAAVWTAMLSALIWYAVLIAVFLAFRHTARQDAVLLAEGDLEDFRRSGMGSLDAFIVQDFFGAGFYHLLLAPIIAVILGSVGAGAALLTRRLARGTKP
jgi:hypothetical protein